MSMSQRAVVVAGLLTILASVSALINGVHFEDRSLSPETKAGIALDCAQHPKAWRCQ